MSAQFPDKVLEFAKGVTKLARDAGFYKVTVNVNADFCDWEQPIQMFWENGRHGDAQNEMRVISTVSVATKV